MLGSPGGWCCHEDLVFGEVSLVHNVRVGACGLQLADPALCKSLKVLLHAPCLRVSAPLQHNSYVF